MKRVGHVFAVGTAILVLWFGLHQAGPVQIVVLSCVPDGKQVDVTLGYANSSSSPVLVDFDLHLVRDRPASRYGGGFVTVVKRVHFSMVPIGPGEDRTNVLHVDLPPTNRIANAVVRNIVYREQSR